MIQILIVEDEVLLAKSLARSLINMGYECVTANSAEDAQKMLENTSVDIVLMDLQLPGASGFEAMKEICRQDSEIAVIIITAYGSMATVVEAMRTGASDFLRKPVDTDELAMAIERVLANRRLKHTVAYYHDREAEKIDEDKLICDSPKMKNLVGVINKLLAMDLPNPSDYPPVLIIGETGVGKDLIARKLHYHSKLSSQPFVAVQCSNLPRGLEEAELFGYEKGSFTSADRLKRGLFETADGGTIFLNEIGELSKEAQVKLLNVIENKSIRRIGGLRDIKVDVRIIAASNRDLNDRDFFREDLYHRLNNMKLEVPSLRERKKDIIPLTELFLRKFSQKYGVRKELSEEAKATLMEYNWVGNVRELRQLMERVTFLATDSRITAEQLGIKSAMTTSSPSGMKFLDNMAERGIDLESIEKELIIQALNLTDGNVSEAARKLNIGREALRYRIKKYSISKLMKIIG